MIAATNEEGAISFIDTAAMKEKVSAPEGIQPLAFSQDGKRFFALTREKKLVLCDVSTGHSEPVALSLTGTENLVDIGISADGNYVAFMYDNTSVEIWDLAQKKSAGILKPAVNRPTAIAWSSQKAEFAIGDYFGKIAICPVEGSNVSEVLPLQSSGVRSLAFSSNGKWLAIGREDGHIVIWNTTGKRVEKDFPGHNAEVNYLIFSPDSSRLISAGLDGSSLVWAVNPFKQIAVWQFETYSGDNKERLVAYIRFDLKGSRLGMLMKDGRLRTWVLHP